MANKTIYLYIEKCGVSFLYLKLIGNLLFIYSVCNHLCIFVNRKKNIFSKLANKNE